MATLPSNPGSGSFQGRASHAGLVIACMVVIYLGGYGVIRASCGRHTVSADWRVVPAYVFPRGGLSPTPLGKLYLPLLHLESRLSGRAFADAPYACPFVAD